MNEIINCLVFIFIFILNFTIKVKATPYYKHSVSFSPSKSHPPTARISPEVICKWIRELKRKKCFRTGGGRRKCVKRKHRKEIGTTPKLSHRRMEKYLFVLTFDMELSIVQLRCAQMELRLVCHFFVLRQSRWWKRKYLLSPRSANLCATTTTKKCESFHPQTAVKRDGKVFHLLSDRLWGGTAARKRHNNHNIG